MIKSQYFVVHLIESVHLLTLIDRSSCPRATVTLMGGSVLLAS